MKATFNSLADWLEFWLVMFMGLFYRSDRYKHQVRQLATEKVLLRHELCNKHVCISDVLKLEHDSKYVQGVWVRYRYITVDGLVIGNYTDGDDFFLNELRERYYKLHKHELLQMRL